MSLEAKGKLLLKYDAQQVTEKFKKREFIVEMTNGMYSEQIKFQLTQDRCALIDKFNKGDDINVHFNLRGKPFQGKTGETTYFTNLEAWRIEPASAATTPTSTPTANSSEVPLPSEKEMRGGGSFVNNDMGGDEDLPF